ncbi:FG-GAP repeat domain-containing protein [Streptomyces hydrogenans]|uniref:FG-GAP repeat domain-containing protein n=1 Tax=Streptomyces hydrogenans TaxID=1873719 RepID=UPI003D752C9C
MLPVRVTRRRTAAAVATVLAVTLGAGALTVPAAVAAPVTAAAATEAQETVAQMPLHTVVDAPGGSAGFFVDNWFRGDSVAWTSYKDGKTVPLGDYSEIYGGDLYVDYKGNVVDMATGARYKLPAENANAVGVAGPYVFTAFTFDNTSGTGVTTLWAHTAEGQRQITGLPAGAQEFFVRGGTEKHGLVRFKGANGDRYEGLVDLATGKVTEIYEVPGNGAFTASDTRVAWVETSASGARRAVVVDRNTETRKTVDLGPVNASPRIALIGDWLLAGAYPGAYGIDPALDYRLRAWNLADASAAPVKLLDRVQSIQPDAGNGLLISGGLVGTGDGTYRIDLDADGRPAATFVAANGSPTETAELSPAKVPSGTVDLNGSDDLSFRWNLNHSDTRVTVELKHVRTGVTYRAVEEGYDEAGGWDSNYDEGFPMGPSWWGQFTNVDGTKALRSPSNGDYTWEMTAESLVGAGPALKRSGSFTVTRTPRTHDFDDNGSVDLLARDASGVLRSDSSLRQGRYGEAEVPETTIGGGWQIYDRIETVGNVAGSVHADVIARDKAGVLWLYQGNGNGGFTGRVQVGGGWQTYDQISGGSDFTGDGRPDLVASDKTGVLWMYKSTGNATKPFDTRKKIGSGWGVYNQLVGTGNIAGAAHGDLLARDKDGVLWMYLGKGDGTFTGRTRIGGGFGRYGELVGAGDYDRDGKNDLLAVDPAAKKTYYFEGTGERYTPFDLARVSTTLHANGSYNLFS